MRLVDYGTSKQRKQSKPRKNKFQMWNELKMLGFNYNLKTVSVKTLKNKLSELTQ